jgi:histidine triad (HIT) family protein
MVSGDIKPDVVLENDHVLAFRDVNPQAPTHILVIPKKHIATLNDLNENDAPVLGQMYLAASQIAAECGIAASGYRTLINCGANGGQTVFHLHLHLMGGRAMHWPPG